MRVLHGIFIALAFMTLAIAAPAGVGVAGESGPAKKDASGASSGGRSRYVFLGGFHGGK